MIHLIIKSLFFHYIKLLGTQIWITKNIDNHITNLVKFN